MRVLPLRGKERLSIFVCYQPIAPMGHWRFIGTKVSDVYIESLFHYFKYFYSLTFSASSAISALLPLIYLAQSKIEGFKKVSEMFRRYNVSHCLTLSLSHSLTVSLSHCLMFYHPRIYAKINGATMVASDSTINFGVLISSLPHVIFSFGTAPE